MANTTNQTKGLKAPARKRVRRQVVAVPFDHDKVRGVVAAYFLRGFSARALDLKAAEIRRGVLTNIVGLNVMHGPSLEAVVTVAANDKATTIFLTLTTHREEEEVQRMLRTPETLAVWAAARVGDAVREYFEAIDRRRR
ncbi:MAG: hypothetical protein ACK4OI_15085 [Rhizobium oryzihabitans]